MRPEVLFYGVTMPSQKITAMPAATPLVGNEPLPIVQAGINKQCNTGQVASLLFPMPINFGSIMYWDGFVFRADGLIFRSTAGVINCSKLIGDSLQIGALPATIDSLGKGTFLTLHAANGFTGTGAYTNFTIKDGIILAAS
jgi:hypothetical protein